MCAHDTALTPEQVVCLGCGEKGDRVQFHQRVVDQNKALLERAGLVVQQVGVVTPLWLWHCVCTDIFFDWHRVRALTGG